MQMTRSGDESLTFTDTYMESQLILVSHNRLAQYWINFRHVSYYQRVDVDRFLVP